MKHQATRGVLLTAAILAVVALAAPPARASITPTNTSVAATSTNSVITEESNGLRFRCPRVDFTGRTSADGRSISGTVAFAGDPATRVTCTDSLFGGSVAVTTSGNITWRSTSSVAGTSASGTLSFDSGFTWTYALLGVPRTIRGPQTPSNCTWTYAQTTGTLFLACTTIAIDGGGELSWSGTFVVRPRLTMS